MAPTEVHLQFLSLRAALRTDLPDLAEFCRTLFGRFLAAEGPADAVLEIFSRGDRYSVRDGVLDAVVDRHEWLPGIVTARLLETAGNEIDDHDLFHAAALSREGRGLILSGESGHGKSVLTLGLLSRGWRFLSDEVAAIDCSKRLLQPFPKAIEVRPGAAELVRLEIEGPLPRGKAMYDAEALFPGSISEPCPPTAVVFLEAQELAPVAKDGKEPLRVVVHRTVPDLPARLLELPGVLSADWAGEQDGCPVLSIAYERGRFAGWTLDDVLGSNGLLVVASSAEERPPTDFGQEPRLETIGRTEGVSRLLGRFRGRRALPRRIAESPHGFSGLFDGLIERFAETRFRVLRVGRLEAALDLLEQAVEGP